MNLFFISDIHGSLPALRRALSIYEESRADRLIILGDVMYHGPRNPLPEGYAPAEVAALLNRYKENIIAVRGNCDSEVDQMLIEYPMMEPAARLQLPERNCFLTHGHIHSPENCPPQDDGTLFAFGHIHLPVAERHGRIYVLNPGSISLPKEGNPPSIGLLEGNRIRVVSLSGDSLCEALMD